MALLEVKNLKLEFVTRERKVRVVEDVSLSLQQGETLGLVGESGSGKSVTALSIARLLPSPPAHYPGGQILLEGRDVLQMKQADLREVRGGVVSYIFQAPATSLNPVMRIGAQVREALRLHRKENSGEDKVIELLKLVHIPEPGVRMRDYPFQLSGGMQQRVMAAMALASQPKLLVADEPTTALDVTIQAQLLELLRELQQRLGMAILLITHNLGLVAGAAQRVAVMYAGQIVESAPTRELIERPLHPYTKALISSVPKLKAGAARLTAIPGTVPRAEEMPTGCRFATRCPIARPECSLTPPALLEVEPERWVRCPYWKT